MIVGTMLGASVSPFGVCHFGVCLSDDTSVPSDLAVLLVSSCLVFVLLLSPSHGNPETALTASVLRTFREKLLHPLGVTKDLFALDHSRTTRCSRGKLFL